MKPNPFIPAALTFGSCLWPVAVEAAFPQLRLEVVCANQINSPVAMVSAGDGTGRMFVCDQRGQIRIFRNGMPEPGVYLDLSPKPVSERSGFDERGLLGMEKASPAVFTLTNLDVLGGNPVPYFIQGFGQDDAGELEAVAGDAFFAVPSAKRFASQQAGQRLVPPQACRFP